MNVTPRHWIVSESGARWRKACWRFVPEWLGQSESLLVHSQPPGEVSARAERLGGGVLLWEIEWKQAAELPTLARMAASGAKRDDWLQIVAAASLTPRDRCALSEMGIAAFIRHPEDLPQLRRMVTGHFARVHRVLH